jgi:hypothetical protein
VSDSIEPAVVDLDDLCDVCRARVTAHTPKRKRSRGDLFGTITGVVILVWCIVAVLGILTLILLRLAGLDL